MHPQSFRGRTVAIGFLTFLIPLDAQAATFYVAPTGSDANPGSMAAPFASWARGQTAASPGDTVYFRGGIYKYTDATSTCPNTIATVNAVVLNKSGSPGNMIRYWAYPGEIPIFNFSGITNPSKYSCRQAGVRVMADWLHLKGLELTGAMQIVKTNHESWGMFVAGGNNDIFELIDSHHNMGAGIFLQDGSNNTFLNCDSHENEDMLSSNGDGQSGDGFGCHPRQKGDVNNVFHGCRAWWNSDDAWDFIGAQESCTVEYSWAWYSGYKPHAVSNGQPVVLTTGDGNGLKSGGYGVPASNVPSPAPQHNLRFNAVFYNKGAGLYANHHPVSSFYYDNTSVNNGSDIDMIGLNGTSVISVGILRNNIAYNNIGHALLSGTMNGGPISDQFNSWDPALNLKVTDADFQSVAFAPPASCPAPFAPGGTPCCKPTDMTCFGGMASARQADGSLPVVPFLRLAATSALIAKGTNVGLPFSGKAPDLGCFDTKLPYGVAGDGGVSSSGTSSSSSGSGSNGGSGSSGSGGMASSGSSSSGSVLAGGSGSSGGTAPGGSPDAGASTSGLGFGTYPNGSGACGCRVTKSSSSSPLLWFALGWLGLVGRRRVSHSRPLPQGDSSSLSCAEEDGTLCARCGTCHGYGQSFGEKAKTAWVGAMPRKYT